MQYIEPGMTKVYSHVPKKALLIHIIATELYTVLVAGLIAAIICGYLFF